MRNTVISFQMLVIFVGLGYNNSHRTCVNFSINTGDILNNTGILDIIEPVGYQMCLDCCKLNSKCLSVIYNREKLKCEFKAEPYPTIQATPLVLRDMDKVCPQDKYSQIKGKCPEVIQGIRLSSGKTACMSSTARFGNIALWKNASLTSTFDEYSAAHQAIDGVWPEAGSNHRCAQTNLEWVPHLKIDLNQEHYVDHVVLLSRGDVGTSHDFALSKIKIYVDSSYCGYFEGPAEPGTNATIVCGGCLLGKVVAVSTWDGISSRYLSVCEVMIIGLRKT